MAYTLTRSELLQPYIPDVVELLGSAVTANPATGKAGEYNDQDIGKAVKYSGNTMVQCASGDDIVGFVTAVESGSRSGYSYGSVRKHGRIKALDEAGTLSVGDLVTAGTAGTLGTLAKANVIAAVAATDFTWVVLAVYGAGAGRECLVERV